MYIGDCFGWVTIKPPLMKSIRINAIKIRNFRSFGEEQNFNFPKSKFPTAIIGYNNSGKTNLINAIKYGLYESVREDTFEIKDFHNCDWNNPPYLELQFESKGVDNSFTDDISYTNTVQVNIENEGIASIIDACSVSRSSKKWYIKKKAPIYYVNFHRIKDEISTQKSSWGYLKSFLGNHIKKMVENDNIMKERKVNFKEALENATNEVLDGKDDQNQEQTQLRAFINLIQINYSNNLRNNACVIQFGFPNYEEIFLQMMFKIGLNGDRANLIPIDHFGDGFISMFVMAVIQSIAETNEEDKCLFLFEEPESFLHENHQEYFYSVVLMTLAQKGHQVIYSTHSHRMVNIFNTDSYIRIELEPFHNNWQTVKKYNGEKEFVPVLPILDGEEETEVPRIKIYTSYIRSIEPNLNKILFSKKVILVEGPNDLMTYSFVIKRKVFNIIDGRKDIREKKKFAETYLSFLNIAIIPHHGKGTAVLLTQLCKHIGLDYYVINDWDFETDFLTELQDGVDLENSEIWDQIISEENSRGETRSIATVKGMITTLRNILTSAVNSDKIHFNRPKLEGVIGYGSDDKNSIRIYTKLLSVGEIGENLMPKSLQTFLEFDDLIIND